MASSNLLIGDCLDVFRDLSGLGAIVSDLPAGIGMMGRSWDRPPRGQGHRSSIAPRSRAHERALQDRDAFVGYWAERLAVGYDACRDDAVALIWALPRTAGWTSRAMEDAGWRVVDAISHLFGQGWTKTRHALKPAREDWIVGVKGRAVLDVEACRVERGESLVRPAVQRPGYATVGAGMGAGRQDEPAGSRPANVVLSHADGCVARDVRRVKATAPIGKPSLARARRAHVYGGDARPRGPVDLYDNGDGTEAVPAYDCLAGCDCGASWLAPAGGAAGRCEACGAAGSWACPVAEVDAQSGDCPSGAYSGIRKSDKTRTAYGRFDGTKREDPHPGSTGGASRFFTRLGYYAKCPGGERHAGTERFLWAVDKTRAFGFRRIEADEHAALVAREIAEGRRQGELTASGNVHPTVKRVALMRWLHALAGAAPIGDLCAGSGSGAIAAHLDGIDWIGAELCPEAIEIAEARLAWWRGLSHAAAADFLATDVMPRAPDDADPRQIPMFND